MKVKSFNGSASEIAEALNNFIAEDVREVHSILSVNNEVLLCYFEKEKTESAEGTEEIEGGKKSKRK